MHTLSYPIVSFYGRRKAGCMQKVMSAHDVNYGEITGVEVAGFVWWITSAVVYVLYLVWAYVPTATLKWYGITYYPSKYWAVAVPTWVCVTIFFVCWAYEVLNTIYAINLSKHKSNLPCGGPEDSYFSSKDDMEGRVLPILEIPEEIVKAVLEENHNPLEAEAVYKRKRRLSQS